MTAARAARLAEVGVSAGMALAFAFVYCPRVSVKSDSNPAARGSVCNAQPLPEPKAAEQEVAMACRYIGQSGGGTITVSEKGDITFESSSVGTVGEALATINALPDWRCNLEAP